MNEAEIIAKRILETNSEPMWKVPMMTNISEVYEKYKHLDRLLSDEGWTTGDMRWGMLADMWKAIKEDLGK